MECAGPGAFAADHIRWAGISRFNPSYIDLWETVGVFPGFLSRCATSPSSSLPHPKLLAWCRCSPFFLTTLHIIMFSKTTLIFLIVGALSVSALTVPVARSPAPEPECEFPDRSLPRFTI